jgi:hypothetical protein
MWSQSPIWFWYVGAGMPAPSSMVPDWLVGWWTVYDGKYYYYYFNKAGLVTYINQRPNAKWTPPMNIGNQGRVQMLEHGPRVTWNPVSNLQATIETYTRVGWTSEDRDERDLQQLLPPVRPQADVALWQLSQGRAPRRGDCRPREWRS